MASKERILWVGVIAAFFVFFVFIAFSPTVFAQSRSQDSEEYLQTFQDIFTFVEENYVEEIDPKTLFEGALKGMFNTLEDPYSYYLDEESLGSLSDTTQGNFGGVGLIISKTAKPESDDEKDQTYYVEVVTPIEGTPAYKAGITAGDFITLIENQPTDDLTIDEVVDKLRGEPGTEVLVTVLRGKDTVLPITLERDIIEVPTVKNAMIDASIGYLKIVQFTPFTDNRVKDALRMLDEAQYRALIIDLRNNPGGLLSSVIDTADLFLEGGTIVSTRSRIPEENDIYTAKRETAIPISYPIITLINRGSASASEILAGALQGNERAIILGETSFGKGSVQQVQRFTDGGFKLTTSRYYTPDGKNIDKIGIEPDRIITEQSLSETEEEFIKEVTENNLIRNFVRDNPDPDEPTISRFIGSLGGNKTVLEDRIVRRMIRDEVNRTNNSPPIYDLEFDIVLREAVQILQSGDYANR